MSDFSRSPDGALRRTRKKNFLADAELVITTAFAFPELPSYFLTSFSGEKWPECIRFSHLALEGRSRLDGL